jgi:Recombination directionality factor-like
MKSIDTTTPPTITTHPENSAAAPLLGRGPARLPTAGRIRAGVKVLTNRAATEPRACEIYEQGLREGRSFGEIERRLADALPQLKHPLIPRNVPWFTVRAHDFVHPELAHQLLETFGEDRGEGRQLYRFPVVFPSDHWPSVMPHELAAWGAHDKRFWSVYSADGRVRHCMCHAPVPVDAQARRAVRLFGGRKVVARDANDGRCEPEVCAEYQRRECNLSGRFVFFVPGLRSLGAFELHTNSFYAMNAAIRTFETVAFLRGGRISGFLDRQGTPFFMSKRLMEVSHIDEHGQAVRVPQWIIHLDVPVDVTVLLRPQDDEAVLAEALVARAALEADPAPMGSPTVEPGAGGQDEEPALAKVLARATSMGIDAARFDAYASVRWGPGWRLNARGRRRVWDELERHANDPVGYSDKVAVTLREVP